MTWFYRAQSNDLNFMQLLLWFVYLEWITLETVKTPVFQAFTNILLTVTSLQIIWLEYLISSWLLDHFASSDRKVTNIFFSLNQQEGCWPVYSWICADFTLNVVFSALEKWGLQSTVSICAFMNILMFSLILGLKNFPLRTMRWNWNELISILCLLWYADSLSLLIWRTLALIQCANPGVLQHSTANEFWHQFLENNLKASFNLPMTHFWSWIRLWQNTADIF